LALPIAPNQVWSMDFVMDALCSGRRVNCLTIVDDFTKEAIDIVPDHSIPGQYVTRVLDQAAQFRGGSSTNCTDRKVLRRPISHSHPARPEPAVSHNQLTLLATSSWCLRALIGRLELDTFARRFLLPDEEIARHLFRDVDPLIEAVAQDHIGEDHDRHTGEEDNKDGFNGSDQVLDPFPHASSRFRFLAAP
jgi:transposase InsO family protein